MNNTKKPLEVLFIGEPWYTHMIYSKGHDNFTSNKYEEGAAWLPQYLKNNQIDIAYMPAHTIQIVFPENVAQLKQYDAVVINGIGSDTFLLQSDTFYRLRVKPNALKLTKECVNNGGGLLMIGGYLSFMEIGAKTNCKNIVPADVLPITMLNGDDCIERPKGVIAQSSQPEHLVIRGFSECPFFLGYNRTIAKENAEVMLTINDNPLLVFDNYHNGKIACFMSGCLPYWDT